MTIQTDNSPESTQTDPAQTNPVFHIADARIEKYSAILFEHYRSPSRGGNGRALHRHAILIDGTWYSFLAVGFRQLAYKTDRVSFDYTVTPEGWNNVVKASLRVIDKDGRPVIRGDHSFKKQLRSSPQRGISGRGWN